MNDPGKTDLRDSYLGEVPLSWEETKDQHKLTFKIADLGICKLIGADSRFSQANHNTIVGTHEYKHPVI